MVLWKPKRKAKHRKDARTRSHVISIGVIAVIVTAASIFELPPIVTNAADAPELPVREPTQTLIISPLVGQKPLIRDSYSVEAPPSKDPQDAKNFAKSLFGDYGWNDDEFVCLDNLWTRESGWQWDAKNDAFAPSKEATPENQAYGIPQSGPGIKMATMGDDWKTNPQTQIRWGLWYIQNSRYGTPCAAWQHSEDNGWY